MSLNKCPECGKEFSEFAPKCPSCGLPTAKIKELSSANNDSNVENKESSKGWTKNHTIRLIIILAVFIVTNIFLVDKSLTVSFGAILLFNAIISFGIGFVWVGFKGGLFTLLGWIFLMFFWKLIPQVTCINADQSYEKRYAYYFIYKTPADEVEFVAPVGRYVYNNTGSTLYITKVGYGNSKYDKKEYQDIYNRELKDVDYIDYYFTSPPDYTKSRGSSAHRQCIDFVRH